MPYLKNDVYSFCDRRKLYGRAGEEVKIIRRREHVLIVEAPSGLRFSMEDEDLVEDPSLEMEPAPVALPVEKQKLPVKRGSRKSAPPNNQNSLF
jgi:hypothetical protein